MAGHWRVLCLHETQAVVICKPLSDGGPSGVLAAGGCREAGVSGGGLAGTASGRGAASGLSPSPTVHQAPRLGPELGADRVRANAPP